MNKKIISILICGTMALSLAACGNSASETTSSESTDSESAELESTESKNTETSETKEQSGSAESNTESGEGYEVTYQAFQLQESHNEISAYAIVEVENTGTANLQLNKSTFTLLNEDGSLAGTISGLVDMAPEIILPGEKGYYFSNAHSVDGDIDVNGDYTFAPELNIEETTKEPVNYEISDLSISQGELDEPDVIGRITNTTDKDESVIDISVVLFDKDEHPLAAYVTNAQDVSAGETATFDSDGATLISMDLSYDDIADYKVFAQE